MIIMNTTKFVKTWTGINPEEIEPILSKFEEYGYFKLEEAKKIRDYRDKLEDALDHKDFLFEEMDDESVSDLVPVLESEFDKVHYIPTGNGVITSILSMNGQIRRPFELKRTGYSNDPFFDFKKLADMVNAYWEISDPYKPSTKIGYGWKFCMDKSNPRAYLFACIRNYLQKNDVEFEMIDVKRICGLADIWDDY